MFLDSQTEHVLSALKGGHLSNHLSGGGYYHERIESFFSERLKCKALLTTSATHALEMMALLLNISPGDEVILPSFTFPSTANAFVLRGAVPKFADCDLSGNISVTEVEELISSRTRAIIAVHYSGGSADLDPLIKLCEYNNIALLEDAAQAVGAFYRGTPLGTLGRMACFSFHDSKIVTAGEGGALILRNESDYNRSFMLRDKGTNRRQFLSGQAERYQWVDIGSSYSLSELNAMYLYPQLVKLGEIIERRKILWNRYFEQLDLSMRKVGVETLKHPSYNSPNYHQFSLLLKDQDQRNHYINFMKQLGIVTPFHYVPLHLSPFGRKWHLTGKNRRSLPQAERFGSTLVRLPLYYNLSNQDQDRVISHTLEWIRKYKSKLAS